MADALEAAMQPAFNAGNIPLTPEVQELKRVIVDAVAAYTKQKEAQASTSQMSVEELLAKRKALLEKANANE